MKNVIANATYNIGIPGLPLTAKGLPAVILYFETGTAAVAIVAGIIYHIVDSFQDPTKRND